MSVLSFLFLGGVAAYFKIHSLRLETDQEYEVSQDIDNSTVEEKIECLQADSIDFIYYEAIPANWGANNKVGLYIYAENKQFFEKADELVNSNGGDWGYVLLPYNVKDYDQSKWQAVFERLNDRHLIPVVQLWGLDKESYPQDTREAARFLNSFAWPIRYKYISVYNEPNSADFWFAPPDPAEYARVLDFTIRTFKEENPDFFVMNGAFNVSAPTNSSYIDSFVFMRRMNQEIGGIFEKLDGWASHPYPQPNFAGSPDAKGRWSIRAYEAELEYLKNTIGVTKTLPVFITETGWAHAEGTNYNSTYLPVDTVSDYFVRAFNEVWLKDDRVRAVMPFTVRYGAPHDHFSWLNDDYVPYKHFDAVKQIKKVKGEPPILKSSRINVGGCEL
ncbi:hypothetical protein A3K34_02595 [candidate division WWE3 bacterium RIFOXYC1_FULL_40_10]|uniref:Asl1-like glycosyl hydrolase catalytic domain-containing protein n=1 Tax=candidate division WWE3 bacterium RIFOXYA2_FULL_46_9 TaxID=1802636 RepID=A0A1F4W2X4_UNCKA|nr:MAG: hypothetical protein A3K58_02595 [candidate division WWE3 bacterium RIFOXYB1_FULL_40_22]OGC61736.1 MAG: hypothetical protein A3K37_02595 [candidate division WWE3 bacterium RIFOXYA1_FULL_40_11]OGC63720.1 MAG: hypothetical protein A2264_05085 [candidate division WWE3 bacterium RIFOXYA2_FULL_46_9]OGC65127.1 MAG: hypothetical protein A2326_01020 [candidate division WWE3 bacterium RIFOXYB2_FULL_41_6]OGC66119.1 MAG: hypothetical protein A3K34_02595 [candidate division WWE3 bacterium RIFOXYC1_